jgi:hypothetical protein
MPKKDKNSPVSTCPKCGHPITSGLSSCRHCGFLLIPPRIPEQVREARDKIGITAGKEDADAEIYRLNKGAAKAQIVTAIVLSFTLVAAVVGAIIAYIDYNTARIEYEARTRPDLFIENIEFNETSDNTTHLLINVTNFGDRPARNIQFEDILVCAESTEGCTIIHGAADENQENIIVYPGRVRTVRIIIEEKDYQSISKTDLLLVTLEYRYGNKEYWYKAELKLHPDGNKWQVEKEQSN